MGAACSTTSRAPVEVGTDCGPVARLVEAETVDLMSLRGTVRTPVKGVTIDAMNEAIRRYRG
jgi:hypothetical protein